MKKPTDNWHNNAIQFPRFIEEAQMAGAFTDDILEQMAESMDLETWQVKDIIERARVKWEAIKEAIKLPEPIEPAPAIILEIEGGVLQSYTANVPIQVYHVDWDNIEDVDNDDATVKPVAADVVTPQKFKKEIASIRDRCGDIVSKNRVLKNVR